jgi:Protein kinase domain
MATIALRSSDVRTLEARLSEGPLSLNQALEYGTLIAAALRELHDSGKVHGRLTPSAVVLMENSAQFLETPASTRAAEGYAAPEVLAGQPPDARSDIFSLGAVICEMILGTPAFHKAEFGAVPEAARPALHSFLSYAMAANPAARQQRMQKVILELKSLTAVCRSEARGGLAAMRAEFESKMRILSERLTAAEGEIEFLRQRSAALEEKLRAALHAQKQTMEAHAAAIESMQVAAEQTDCLVERTLDAMGLMLDLSGEP